MEPCICITYMLLMCIILICTHLCYQEKTFSNALACSIKWALICSILKSISIHIGLWTCTKTGIILAFCWTTSRKYVTSICISLLLEKVAFAYKDCVFMKQYKFVYFHKKLVSLNLVFFFIRWEDLQVWSLWCYFQKKGHLKCSYSSCTWWT